MVWHSTRIVIYIHAHIHTHTLTCIRFLDSRWSNPRLCPNRSICAMLSTLREELLMLLLSSLYDVPVCVCHLRAIGDRDIEKIEDRG